MQVPKLIGDEGDTVVGVVVVQPHLVGAIIDPGDENHLKHKWIYKRKVPTWRANYHKN